MIAIVEIYRPGESSGRQNTIFRIAALPRIFDSFTRTGTITVNPNPIQICDGSKMVVANLSWTSKGTKTVEVRVGSPDGKLFVNAGPGAGKATTDKWVTDGMVFYLQDVSGGLPLTEANTLATVTVKITAEGC